jgi:Asp/Glu/hydantoin racemase
MAPTKRSILVINPNTTEAMTDGLKPLISSLSYKPVSQTTTPAFP